MTTRMMRYDIKKKLNKLDSQAYRNLLIPEIDWLLNEAIELFIKMVASPRVNSYLGFEKIQRNTDDIRTLVKTEDISIVSNIAPLPADYWHYITAKVSVRKGSCGTFLAKFIPQQHDDDFEESPFDKSSFEWRVVNGVFNENGVEFFTDGSFDILTFPITYLRKHIYVHDAEQFRTGTYTLPDGTVLTGTANCELPEHTHREIVDIAVLLATGEIQASDLQLKMVKLQLNNLK